MQVQGITWHAVTLDADQFAATRTLMTEVFGLTPAADSEGWTLFTMPNGTVLELYAPEEVPDYGFNDGVTFGYRVDDIDQASTELVDAGCELLGEITRLEEAKYAYRDFRGPDGRVYGINQRL